KRVERPETFASGRVIRIQKSGNRMLAARHSHNHLVLHGERRAGSGITAGSRVVVHLGLPQLTAGLSIDRDQVHVQGVHEESSPKYRQAPVYLSATVVRLLWILMARV